MSAPDCPLISLVMIVKNEEAALPTCLASVKSIVDEYVIVDTGSTDGTAAVIAQYTDAVHKLPFEDFVTTKNKALALATGAYILFMDADERLLAGHDILKQAAQHGEGAIGARIVEGDWPTVNNAYYRLRLWRNSGEWRFVGPGVHEVIMGPDAVTWHADVVVQHDHSHRTPQSYDKRYALYVQLLHDALVRNPDDLRAWFYLARTEKDAGQHLAAIAAYDEYLSRNPTWRDETWQAHFDSALCWQQLGEYGQAFDALQAAAEVDPRRAEAYCQRGDIYMFLGEWANAVVAYETALTRTEPADVLLFHNPNAYRRYPADQLVLAYDKLHLYADGLRAARTVLDAYPKPQTRLVNNLTWLRSMSERRWLFALGATPEPVYGDMLARTGAGGVETTYIELPKALAARGQRVIVACNCNVEHDSDGVTFIPYPMLSEYLAWYHPQVLVASRWHDALLDTNADQKFLWLQDAWFAETPAAVWGSVRGVVVSSPWHRTYVAQRAGSEVVRKTQVIPLGIRKAQFADLGVERKPHQLIYSSNPDRGLQTLVNAWPQITATVPDVNLIVAYGWEGLLTWSGDPAWQAQQEAMRDRFTAWAADAGNVRFTGRLPKAELYRHMAASAICAYPNNFWETFCLTALECQAAGTPLVTSALGALPTTCNLASNILLSGDPQSAVYQERFAAAVIDLLRADTQRDAMRAACLDYIADLPCDWADIAQKWLTLVWSD